MIRGSPLRTQHSLLSTRRKAARRWTVAGLVRYGARRLRAAGVVFGHGTDNARDEAAWLVLHALGLRPQTDLDAGKPVGTVAAGRALDLIARRIRTRKPAAYLTRAAWLGGMPFHVDERVVVPRSHIAALLADRLAPWIADRRPVRSALDLCTGSGCLGVLLARAFPRARVDAADLFPGALSVARINVRRYRLGRRVRLVRSDLFSSLRGRRYDVIVSNPPYVSAGDMRKLPPEYRSEPAPGLAGGRDGLDCVRRILRQAHAHLEPGGLLVVEVGRGKQRLERAFPRVPFAWPETAAGHAVFVLQREQLPYETAD